MSGGRTPVEVCLFVHRELNASLLCSEHGAVDGQGQVVDAVIVPWSQVSWPDDEQLHAFRRWQLSPRAPLAVTFAVPGWLAREKGLI